MGTARQFQVVFKFYCLCLVIIVKAKEQNKMRDLFYLNLVKGLAIARLYTDFPAVLSNSYQLKTQGIDTQSGTTYTLLPDDNGMVVVFTNSSAVTLTVPSGLNVGFSCSVVQYGAGQVTISAGSGATLRLRSGSNKTGGQYAVVSLLSVIANEYIVTGDTTT